MRAVEMSQRTVRNEQGSVMAEFAAVAMLFFLTVSGVVEFGYFMWQYGAVGKGAQYALRHAAVSDPVTRNSVSLTSAAAAPIRCWMEDGGNSTRCSSGQSNHESMRCILIHMQNFATFVEPENIEVTYEANSLGFGGEIAPTIKLTLTNLQFPTLFLGYLAGRTLPDLDFTITAEDLSSMPPAPGLNPDTATTTCGISA